MLDVPHTLQAFRARTHENLLVHDSGGTWCYVPESCVLAAIHHLERLSNVTPKSRAGNPDTSRKAAAKARRCQGQHHRAILRALRMCGQGGGTVLDIANRTGWHGSEADGPSPCRPLERHEIGKRMSELVRLGLVERTGEERDGFGIYRLTRKES